jgi:hypothetical protein
MSNTNKNDADDFMGVLTAMIDDLFKTALSDKEKPMQEQTQEAPTEEQTDNPVYESIEDYTAQTGKRFRMTKDQKSRNLSREQAFTETFGGSN